MRLWTLVSGHQRVQLPVDPKLDHAACVALNFHARADIQHVPPEDVARVSWMLHTFLQAAYGTLNPMEQSKLHTLLCRYLPSLVKRTTTPCVCYICLEPVLDSHLAKSPCACRMPCHRACLDAYRKLHPDDPCTICQQPYTRPLPPRPLVVLPTRQPLRCLYQMWMVSCVLSLGTFFAFVLLFATTPTMSLASVDFTPLAFVLWTPTGVLLLHYVWCAIMRAPDVHPETIYM